MSILMLEVCGAQPLNNKIYNSSIIRIMNPFILGSVFIYVIFMHVIIFYNQ